MRRRLTIVHLTLAAGICSAQVCTLSVAGLNRSRQVMGPVSAECANPVHTAPFGNWGVTSNFGVKSDSHQFDGWCHDTPICDNDGRCRTECRDGWYEWNSCTTDPAFQPPNCTLYNAGECTAQVTATGINVHGTRNLDISVRCPRDNDGDGFADEGGCADAEFLSHGTNFMSLYELDPFTGDDLVQTLYFPDAQISTGCGVYGCPPSASEWMAPSAYDSPAAPAKAYAEIQVFVNGGWFWDPDGACPVVAPLSFTVSAANYGASVSPASIVTTFGASLMNSAAHPASAGSDIVIEVTDSRGITYPGSVLYASPTQVNWIVPPGTDLGVARVVIRDSSGPRATGELLVERVAPAIFTADSTGQGVAAALAVRALADGSQTVSNVFQCGDPSGGCVEAALEAPGPDERLVLVLFGTGIRGRASIEEVEAAVGGLPAEVHFAGAQGQYSGLDQVNIEVPPALAGSGLVEIELSVAGRLANRVTVLFR